MTNSPQLADRFRPCLLVVAAAGYGKTAALEGAAADSGAYYRAAELSARPAADWLAPRDGRAVTALIVDDVCGLSEQTELTFAETLSTLPRTVAVSLASRRPLHEKARARLRGPVRERGPADLALSPQDIARVLREEHGVEDAELARQTHRLTAGWPALVQFAGDVLGRQRLSPKELSAALTEVGTSGAAWISDQVIGELAPDSLAILDLACDVEGLSVALCAELAPRAGLPPERAVRAFHWLRRTGILVPDSRFATSQTLLRVVPLVAGVFAAQRASSASADRHRDRLEAAADWYARNDEPLHAAVSLSRSGRAADATALIEQHADRMFAAGGAREVSRLLAADPGARRAHTQLLLGDALRRCGEATAARHIFEPLVSSARTAGGCDPGLAWRAGMVHYMCAEYRVAIELFELGRRAEPAGADDAILLACRSAAHEMLGEFDAAADLAQLALSVAERCVDSNAVALAHIAAANVTQGARRDDHLARALAAAEGSRDVVTTARVLLNQAHGHLRAARYPDAFESASRAVAAAEIGSPPGIQVMALHNLGEALTRLGRFDEARFRFETALGICRATGLRRTAMCLWGLAEVYRQSGRYEQSRAAFEEAVDLAGDTDEAQILVPALTGLARLLLADGAAGADRARPLAVQAESIAPEDLAPYAYVARGWVALADGDSGFAAQRADAAVRAARVTRTADALADALELLAAAAPERAVEALREAHAIWQGAGADPAADRVLVLLGRLPGADGTARLAARAATRRVVASGVHTLAGLPLDRAGGATPVHIRVLGGFEVTVYGRPVPLPAWRSKQARTLVKILVSRWGRHVSRGELSELLWPDDDPGRTGHRLSVLLSAVRGVLDPDKSFPVDHFIRADAAGLALDISRTVVDSEHLLQDAVHAEMLLRSGQREAAHEMLAEVDAAYRGDAFDDEPYEDWADGLREEVRAVWLRCLRHRSELDADRGDHRHAATLLVRMLGADPYDEGTYRALVRALISSGRHGEARRVFDRWAKAMRSIGVPGPDPAQLRPRARQSAVRIA